jgi:hypothetical protein
MPLPWVNWTMLTSVPTSKRSRQVEASKHVCAPPTHAPNKKLLTPKWKGASPIEVPRHWSQPEKGLSQWTLLNSNNA